MAASTILRLAAAPTFAAMATVTLLAEPAAPPLCGSASGWAGMGVMYALMAAFHLPVWLSHRSTGQTCIQE